MSLSHACPKNPAYILGSPHARPPPYIHSSSNQRNRLIDARRPVNAAVRCPSSNQKSSNQHGHPINVHVQRRLSSNQCDRPYVDRTGNAVIEYRCSSNQHGSPIKVIVQSMPSPNKHGPANHLLINVVVQSKYNNPINLWPSNHRGHPMPVVQSTVFKSMRSLESAWSSNQRRRPHPTQRR